MEVFNYDVVVTHSTVFHADDVFGVALCRIINPEIYLIRTLEPDRVVALAKGAGRKSIVFDIGLGKYDHHQEDKALRPDGTPYCGFGLLWRDFGYLLCPDEEARKIVDDTFVYPIDQADNGIKQNLLSQAIKSMNPCWNSKENEDGAFNKALDVAIPILKAVIAHANAAVEAEEAVLESYLASPTEEILILDEYLPYSKVVSDNPKLKNVLFVVYPSKRGGWNVQTVTKEPGTFVNRMDFPESWLGHADPDRGIHFAHTSNFLIACDTKEQAIKVAEEAVEAGKDGYSVAGSI